MYEYDLAGLRELLVTKGVAMNPGRRFPPFMTSQRGSTHAFLKAEEARDEYFP